MIVVWIVLGVLAAFGALAALLLLWLDRHKP